MLGRLVQKRALQEAEDEEVKPEAVTAPDAVTARPPPRKLARRVATAADDAPSTALRVRDSALFHPTRAMGVVTDGLPFSHVTLGDADFLTVSVGRGFQVFECSKLRLAYIGPRLREKVRCLLCVGEVALTALKTDIVAWHKLTELGRFRGHTSTVNVMCTVGTGYLVSGSAIEILVWQLSDIGTEKKDANDVSTRILSPLGKLQVGPGFGSCTAAIHPATYLHKVLLASSTGVLALWNVRSQQSVHVFKGLSTSAGAKKNDAITALCDAPNVLDVVAVGFASGRICVLNIREDTVIVEFEQVQGRVSALTFRTGSGAPSHMISAAPNGSFVVWDLDKRHMHHVHDEAHRGPVIGARFLPNQPVLITTGRDNSIKMWIFDTPDGIPRLLKQRVGCPGPVARMFWYGNDDKELIVGGRCDNDSGFVSKVSFIQDQQTKEYSHAARKKLPGHMSLLNGLPPVVDMAVCEVRHFDWPAIVTAHQQCDAALIWSVLHTSLAPVVMRPPLEADRAPVSSVALSPCGNYCVIGLENGGLHRFNLQSQLYRGSLPKVPEIIEATPKAKAKAPAASPRAHRGRVCGLAITVSGNVLSVASHPQDCMLRVWKLMSHEELQSIPLAGGRPGSPSCLLLRQHGALVAVALDDGALLLVDLYSGTVVRSFDCGMPVVDAAFSPEGRWVAAALRGGGLRIFDLPASRCVDFITFNRPPVAICFSPSTAFLLISHAKSSSIQVWANKFLFDPSLSAPLLCPEPSEPIHVDELDDLHFEVESNVKDRETAKAPAAEPSPTSSVKPLEPEMLTLSDVPPAKWQATLHLDLIKERNKAIEAPKPVANAPFFLPTSHDGVKPVFVVPVGEDADAQPASRHIRDRSSAVMEAVLPMQSMLLKGDFDGALTFLKAQTPSGVHLAIEELGPLAQGSLEDLESGLKFFEHHLEKAHFADELQAYLSLFLQAHGEELANDDALRSRCGDLAKRQVKLWNTLDVRCQKVRCFLGTLTHTQSQW